MVSQRAADTLFGSFDVHCRKSELRAWIWIIPSMLLGIYNFLYCDPFIFSPILEIGAISPHEGYAKDMVYLVYSLNYFFTIFYNN
jgi:hypothetical protein